MLDQVATLRLQAQAIVERIKDEDDIITMAEGRELEHQIREVEGWLFGARKMLWPWRESE